MRSKAETTQRTSHSYTLFSLFFRHPLLVHGIGWIGYFAFLSSGIVRAKTDAAPETVVVPATPEAPRNVIVKAEPIIDTLAKPSIPEAFKPERSPAAISERKRLVPQHDYTTALKRKRSIAARNLSVALKRQGSITARNLSVVTKRRRSVPVQNLAVAVENTGSSSQPEATVTRQYKRSVPVPNLAVAVENTGSSSQPEATVTRRYKRSVPVQNLAVAVENTDSSSQPEATVTRQYKRSVPVPNLAVAVENTGSTSESNTTVTRQYKRSVPVQNLAVAVENTGSSSQPETAATAKRQRSEREPEPNAGVEVEHSDLATEPGAFVEFARSERAADPGGYVVKKPTLPPANFAERIKHPNVISKQTDANPQVAVNNSTDIDLTDNLINVTPSNEGRNSLVLNQQLNECKTGLNGQGSLNEGCRSALPSREIATTRKIIPIFQGNQVKLSSRPTVGVPLLNSSPIQLSSRGSGVSRYSPSERELPTLFPSKRATSYAKAQNNLFSKSPAYYNPTISSRQTTSVASNAPLPQTLAYYNPIIPSDGSTSNGNSSFIFPLPIPAPTTSAFGWRVHPILKYRRFHPGTDLGAPMGTPILAASTGKIETANWMGSYGKAIVIQHNESQRTLYGHLSEIFVQPGQWVEQGTVIGRVGSTGRSTGPHLHFETRLLTSKGWVTTNPATQLELARAQLLNALGTAQAAVQPSS